MSQDTVAVSGLHIGIEAELLLQAITFEEDRDIPDLKTFAYMVAASYRESAPDWVAGMHEEVGIDGVQSEDASRFTEWVLTDDKSIEPAPYNPDISPRQWPLELVSPVLEFNNGSNFRSQVEYVWEHPKSEHEHLCQRILRHAYPLIPSEQQWNLDLVGLMNNGNDKYFGWNLLNLLEDGKTTIEFRRPPAVTSPKECLAWIEFTVTFVQAAVQSGNTLTNNMGVAANVQALKNFLDRVTVSGGEPTRFDAIFRGNFGAVFPQKVDMIGYSPGELDKIERMKAKGKKNLMREKMKQSRA